ncbi:MAG: TolC family protein [Mucinivorans sp.]
MNKKIIILSLFLVAIILSGCVTKKYKSPEVNFRVDSLYRVLESKVDTTMNTGEVGWENFFSDTVLQYHIQVVLSQNHDMLVAKKRMEQAYAQLRAARGAFWPSVSAQIGGTLAAQDNHTLSLSPGITASASWEIDLWGKLASAKRASQASLSYSEDMQQALQTQLVAQTATYYYQLVAYDAERDIINETIINRAQYLDTIRIMKLSGKVNEVAVQQAVAQLGEVRAALPDIELAIIETENALSLLMGHPSDNVNRIKHIDFRNVKGLSNIGVPAQLLSNRPDVRAAEQNYRNAHELYNVSRAAMYPTLGISANGGIADVFNSHFGTLNLLASLTQPIFNGRKLRAQKEVNKLSAEQAAINFEKKLLEAGMEVSNALARQEKSTQKALAQIGQLDGYLKAYNYSFELFMNGYATYLDVLTAQTGVFNIQIALVDSYLANLSARIELYRALGGGSAPYKVETKEQARTTDKENYGRHKKSKKWERGVL